MPNYILLPISRQLVPTLQYVALTLIKIKGSTLLISNIGITYVILLRI